MANQLGRIMRLEGKRPALPWHLPVTDWTDEQIEMAGRDIVDLTDSQLQHLSADMPCTD